MDGEGKALAICIVFVLVLGFVFMIAENQAQEDCKNKGGVYITRIDQCVKKDFFIQ